MSKPNIHTNIIGILVFEMNLTTILTQLVSIVRAKFWMAVMKCKNNVF